MLRTSILKTYYLKHIIFNILSRYSLETDGRKKILDCKLIVAYGGRRLAMLDSDHLQSMVHVMLCLICDGSIERVEYVVYWHVSVIV